jgi:hypothetical protein
MMCRMPPDNDPGKSSAEDSPPQLREPFPIPPAMEETSSDDDGEEDDSPEASGYAQLPQEPPGGGQDDNDDGEGSERDDEDDFADFSNFSSAALSPGVLAVAEADQRSHNREEAAERLGLFKEAGKVAAAPLELDSSKVESIRAAMSAFSLPESAVPKWAKEISEDEWKEMVKKKLKE